MAYVGGDPAVILDPSAIFKGYDMDGSNFAVFRDSELAALRARRSSELPVTHFVDPSEIPQKYYEKSYDVWPDYGGDKGYELFCIGLRDKKLAAMGELPLYGRERTVTLQWGRRGLVLYTLFCDGEVNFDDEYELKPGLASERELELTRTLMTEQRRPFDPSALRDKYQERVLELVLTRCQSAFPMVADGTSASEEPAETPRRAPVLSVEEALNRSLEMIRKPVKSEGNGKSPRKKKRKRRTK
jgi:DNA end-binding protein Ku